MELERWRQVERVLILALDVPHDKRAVWLEQTCARDEDLRREVVSLLQHEALAEQFIETPAPEIAAKLLAGYPNTATQARIFPQAGSELTGRIISHYRVLEKLGEGGMGTVYRAVRADDVYEKDVAIKFVRPDGGAGFVLQRFESERRILADLEHPNIARLLDGGTTDDSVPFLVMELVEGQAIDSFCDSRRLPTADRLKLFCNICSAVQYAHQRLVIHRDLKPGNILVTAEGVPKLLDFGIAKILKPEPLEGAIDNTDTLLHLMTPEYASPEQLCGRTVSTATDVYSLGVVLYSLLTGHLPYRFSSRSPYEVAQAVCEVEAEPASAAVCRFEDANGARIALTPELVSSTREGSPEKLRRRLTGDIDSILHKALRKEPEHRYASVEQFAEDVRRHLDGLPVLGRQGTIAYRGSKFLKRHKAGALMAGLAVLTLVIGMAGIVREARIAEAQRVRAERRFNDVRDLASSLMFDINESIQNLPGATMARNLVVNKAQHYLDSLAREAAGDRSLQRELAEGYQRVGDIQGLLNSQQNLGNTAAALESYGKAVRIREALAASGSSDAESSRALAGLYHKIGELAAVRNDFVAAAENDRKSLALSEALYSANPKSVKAARDLVAAYNGISRHLGFNGDFAQATNYDLQSLGLAQQLVAASPNDKTLRLTWAILSRQGCYDFSRTGDYTKALGLCHQAIEITEAIAAANPNDVRSRFDVCLSYCDLARALSAENDWAQSLEAWRKALAINEAVLATDPKDARAQVTIGSIWERAGWLVAKTSASTDLQYELKSLEVRKRMSAADPTNLGRREALASSYSTLGDVEVIFASRPRVAASRRKEYCRLAMTWYQSALDILLQLRAAGALRGADGAEPDRVVREMAKCGAAPLNGAASAK